ncbi:MAG TPA: fibronectin type III domain-containing protein [Chloroflexia bacterium]|nr:fibronectin type III domain-containing protein [Chloroflexia bacterium]
MRYSRPGETISKLIGLGLTVVFVSGLFVMGLNLTGGTALSQAQSLKASWNLSNPPTEGRVGLRLSITNLELANDGTQAWPKAGPNQIRLGYRWFGADNKPLDPKNKDNGYDELRADLPQDIPPGGRLIYPQFLVAVPNAAGDYTLHIDLVQGNNSWLADKGSPDLSFKVTVRAKDTTAPTTTVLTLPLYETATSFTVKWQGKDEDNGSGLSSFDIQYKVAGESDWRDWLLNTNATSALFTGDNGKLYLFRSRATDHAGNAGKYPDNEQASTRVDSLPPSARVEILPEKSPEVFLVRWSSFDNVSVSATALCDVQYREGNGPWTDWQIGTSVGSALFQGEAGKAYSFRARATDYAGNIGDYSAEAQATTTVAPALDTLTGASPVMTNSTSAGGNATVTPGATTPAGTTAAATTAAGSTTSAATTEATTTEAGTTAASTTVAATTPAATTSAATTPAATASTTATVTGTPSATITATAGASTPAAGTPQSAFFPLAVKLGENGTGTTSIMVTNPGTTPLDVFVRFNDRGGAPVSTTTNNQEQPVSNDAAAGLARVETVLKTLQPGETVNVWAGVVPPPNFNGWVEVRAAGNFQAYAVRVPATGRAVQYASASAGKQLYLPYIKKADPLTSSYVNLANTTATPADYTITYYDGASGNVVATEKRSLPRYGSARIAVGGISTSDPGLKFSGSATITSNTALTASVENMLEDGTPTTYPAAIAASQSGVELPVYREADGITTAVLIQNTGKDSVSFKLEYLDDKGTVLASKDQSLAGYARLSAWQGDVKDLPSGYSGKVRVTTSAATNPLVVTVLGASSELKNRQFS